ncbi:MAG: transporter associated domain-containing protein [Pseudomonadota bacterium]
MGFVHIKDVVAELAETGGVCEPSAEPERAQPPLERLHRKMMYVPASMKLPDLLVRMQSTRIHLALVVDEYGGTDGIVSLEDLVEEIVGEIEDEHDDDPVTLIRRGRQVWEADARFEIDDFEGETGLDLALPDYEDEIDTLGGVAFALAGRIPVRGEVLSHPAGIDIEIVDADTRRIRRLRLRAKPASPAAGPSDAV